MRDPISQNPEVPRWTGLAVVGISLALYLSTFCREAFPVASSLFITTRGGIDPFQSYEDPLWALLLRLLRGVPLGNFALRANLLSVPLAVLSLWLMYYVVAHIRHNRTPEERQSPFPGRAVGAVSGAFAAAFLAVSPPFWFIATRAHPMVLNVAMVLGCAALFVVYGETRRRAPLYLACLLVGLSLLEFPTMILLAPCFGVWALYLVWRARELTLLRAAGMAGAVFAGYAILLIVAAWFVTTETFALRDMGGYWDLVLRMIKDQVISLRSSAPRLGWLTVAIFMVLPWFVVVVIPRRAAALSRPSVGSVLLNVVLGVVGFLILFNTQLAPFHLLELQALLVTPYLFTACWMGYLAGYWFTQFRWPPTYDPVLPKAMSRVGDKVYLPALGVSLAVALWWNAPLISRAQAAPAARAARELVANLDGRTWLLSNGYLDAMIQLAADEAGVELTLIDTSRVHLAPYRRYLGSVLTDSRLRLMIEIGLPQMLAAWARIDPAFPRKFAVLASADTWRGQGIEAVPAAMMFLGEAADAPLTRDVEPDMTFFADLVTLQDNFHGAPGEVRALNHWVREHASKIANATGCYLEDQGQSDAAFRSYSLARELAPENVSALLNIGQLAVRESRPEADELADEVKVLTDRTEGNLDIWSVSYHWGDIRDPAALRVRSRDWASSGRLDGARLEIRRALELSGSTATGADQLALAALSGQVGDGDESERLYHLYLEKNPDDVRALSGLCVLEIHQGDAAAAAGHLARLEELDVPELFLEIQWGGLELLRGNAEAAAKRFDRALTLDPHNVRALLMRALLPMGQGDPWAAEDLTRELESLSPSSPSATLALAELAIHRGDVNAGRAYLESLVSAGDESVLALRRLLALDSAQDRGDLGERHAKALLQLDPRDARSQLYLGSLLYDRGEFGEAETAYRASLAVESSYDALNNLAWILVRDERYEAGLRLAESALTLNPDSFSVWDTRGVALHRLGRLDEAVRSLRLAVELSQGQPAILAHLADALSEQANVEEARAVLAQLDAMKDSLPEDVADEVTQIRSRLP